MADVVLIRKQDSVESRRLEIFQAELKLRPRERDDPRLPSR